MLKLFRKVSPSLYRASAPAPDDLIWLKKKFDIQRVVSLDDASANKIALTCQLLGIEHILLPIDYKRSSVIRMLSSFDAIFEGKGADKKTLVHCFHGKDRCGLFIALYRTKVEGWDPKKAIKEADSLGFCTGLPPDVSNLYHSIIVDSSKQSQIESDEMDVIDSYDAPMGYTDYRDYTPLRMTEDELEHVMDLDPFHHLNEGGGPEVGSNPGTSIPGAGFGFGFPGIYPAI